MAKEDPQTLCERLFETFLAPLVLGGPMRPGKPVGGKASFGIGDHRAPANVDLVSRVGLARVRVARKLAPIDTFEPAPDAQEWVLAAVLHDLVQATHPGFDAAFRRSGPKRLLEIADKTLDRIAPPRNVGEALSRHTWFSRMFELARTDVDVRWWTGSERFLGTEPPKRLVAWPELRRVTQTRTPHPLMELPRSGGAVDLARFTGAVQTFLKKSPLTDLATLARPTPPFLWTNENLPLVSTHAGRTIVLRALAPQPVALVSAALGRATRLLFAAKAMRALFVAADLLRDRALMLATARLEEDDFEPITLNAGHEDASFALGVGALVATQWIAQTGGGFGEDDRRKILRVLHVAASSAAAKEVQALLSA